MKTTSTVKHIETPFNSSQKPEYHPFFGLVIYLLIFASEKR